MDRQIVYAGSIPLDTDLLNIQRNVMASLGALAQVVLGTGVVSDGLRCVPGPSDYTVSVGPGTLTALQVVGAAAFGSLAADATPMVRTGMHAGDTVLQLAPPSSPGNVGCFLVQAALQEVDTGPVALPYWNAANPAVPFSGPGNSGAAQATKRLIVVTLGLKASVQLGAVGVVPDADPGWVGLYGVTTRAGKPAIAAGDIAAVSGSPALRFTLPAMPPGYSQQMVFNANTVWRAPAGVRWARVRVVGAGGGGGGGDTSFSGGGGGAGGYAEAVVPLVPVQAYAVTVGSGGAAAVAGSTGGGGGTSDFGGLVTAGGGQGGSSANPDCHGGAPGRGLAGGILVPGGYGGDGALVAERAGWERGGECIRGWRARGEPRWGASGGVGRGLGRRGWVRRFRAWRGGGERDGGDRILRPALAGCWGGVARGG